MCHYSVLSLTLVTLKAIYLLLQTLSESSLDNGYQSASTKKENNLVDKEKHWDVWCIASPRHERLYSRHRSGSDLLFQDHWINALQTLELSLEEVVHIRWGGRVGLSNPSLQRMECYPLRPTTSHPWVRREGLRAVYSPLGWVGSTVLHSAPCLVSNDNIARVAFF